MKLREIIDYETVAFFLVGAGALVSSLQQDLIPAIILTCGTLFVYVVRKLDIIQLTTRA